LETASLAVVVCGRPEDQAGKCREYWPLDCGAAIENLLLQAAALGYGTCWCGCYPLAHRVEEMQKILEVGSIPLAVIAVGKSQESPAARGFLDEARVKYL